MRIIGTIPHPTLKISVFKADGRVSVKFENAGYEQTYKLGADDRFGDLDTVRRWADAILIESVLARMADMHGSRTAADARAFPVVAETEFEEIL
ncbi:MAG: hypothetical protein ABMA02_04130 [Saprospiraceae bacterium]